MAKVNAADLYEIDEDTGDLIVTPAGEMLFEKMDELVEARQEALIEMIDEYFAKVLAPVVEAMQEKLGVDDDGELTESSEEDSLRDMIALAVQMVGGPEARLAFITKVAALARQEVLSSATGEWSQGVLDNSARNRDSVHGAGNSHQVGTSEDMEVLKAEAHSVLAEVTADLDEDDVDRLKVLAGQIEFDGDTKQLREDLMAARESFLDNPRVASYTAALSRTVRRG